MNFNEFSLHQHTCDIRHVCFCVHTLPYMLVIFLFLFLRMNFSNPMSLRTSICFLERDSKVSSFIMMSLYSKLGYFSCRHLIDRWKWLFCFLFHIQLYFLLYIAFTPFHLKTVFNGYICSFVITFPQPLHVSIPKPSVKITTGGFSCITFFNFFLLLSSSSLESESSNLAMTFLASLAFFPISSKELDVGGTSLHLFCFCFGFSFSFFFSFFLLTFGGLKDDLHFGMWDEGYSVSLICSNMAAGLLNTSIIICNSDLFGPIVSISGCFASCPSC